LPYFGVAVRGDRDPGMVSRRATRAELDTDLSNEPDNLSSLLITRRI
jgi:hypothetical protein